MGIYQSLRHPDRAASLDLLRRRVLRPVMDCHPAVPGAIGRGHPGGHRTWPPTVQSQSSSVMITALPEATSRFTVPWLTRTRSGRPGLMRPFRSTVAPWTATPSALASEVPVRCRTEALPDPPPTERLSGTGVPVVSSFSSTAIRRRPSRPRTAYAVTLRSVDTVTGRDRPG